MTKKQKQAIAGEISRAIMAGETAEVKYRWEAVRRLSDPPFVTQVLESRTTITVEIVGVAKRARKIARVG